ncbi:Chitin synthase, class 5, partial [Monosporozyma unispora]
MSTVEVVLTVGKLDASLALLTTQDHHVIEFPTMLLPDNVKAGSIITMNVRENVPEEQRQRKTFEEIQRIILEKYGSKRPQAPVLKVVNTTQTSCVLSWDELSLGSAKLKQLILYRQGVRSAVIPNPFKVTSTKISGLSVDTPYEFQLKLVTTSGQFWSEKVKVRTHKMTDMSGITVCLGPLDPLLNITERQIKACLKIVGARHLQKHVAIDTTHFICNDLDNEEDEELIKAKNSNIPIVRPEWIRACAIEKRIVGVRGFYLDADKGILKSYPFPPASTDTANDSSEEEFVAVEAAATP